MAKAKITNLDLVERIRELASQAEQRFRELEEERRELLEAFPGLKKIAYAHLSKNRKSGKSEVLYDADEAEKPQRLNGVRTRAKPSDTEATKAKAAELLKAGMTPVGVAKQLGHSTTSTVYRVRNALIAAGELSAGKAGKPNAAVEKAREMLASGMTRSAVAAKLHKGKSWIHKIAAGMSKNGSGTRKYKKRDVDRSQSVLVRLQDEERPFTAPELAKLESTDIPNIHSALRTLMKRKLVSKHEAKVDGKRVMQFELTKKGEAADAPAVAEST